MVRTQIEPVVKHQTPNTKHQTSNKNNNDGNNRKIKL